MLLKAWEFFSRHYREVKLSPPPLRESPDKKISWSIQQEFNAFCQSLKSNNTMFWGLDVNLLLFLREAGVFTSDFRLLLWIFVKTGSHWHVYWMNHTSNILVMGGTVNRTEAKHSLRTSSVAVMHLLKGHSGKIFIYLLWEVLIMMSWWWWMMTPIALKNYPWSGLKVINKKPALEECVCNVIKFKCQVFTVGIVSTFQSSLSPPGKIVFSLKWWL